ncbi:TetR/AcrR family transcriptional regulator [Blastococcus sp. CCUG 61487]|uniref:TetR/AcrR family transcriptional regulator n=1 Tax=Blastococcus sp. CCUG 61487 TaxID=1840703 RepID=UPI0010C094CF|nr:TetR/AcrR family transcriptional regulator [Blastococcus sp. CCUG 61487]TKJ33623.1 TetR family transcriptional regulator [Blastococcus sp. CCUG 61487]
MTVLSPDDVRPSRGGRPRDPSRDEVIRAAILRLLADVGYAGLTMDAVAAEAGVGKATIYRRWRTKEDLVVDTVSDLNAAEVVEGDTGSLEGDLRVMLRALVAMVNSPVGAATQALLSSMQHQPALAEAFRSGPLAIWTAAFNDMWVRAEARGEVAAGLAQSLVSEAIGAPIVQRWLVNGEPIDDAFADAVVDVVALPVLRAAGANV